LSTKNRKVCGDLKLSGELGMGRWGDEGGKGDGEMREAREMGQKRIITSQSPVNSQKSTL
jgi:hypothetical protein